MKIDKADLIPVDALPAVLQVVDGDEWCGRCNVPVAQCACGGYFANAIRPPASWEGIDLTCQTCNGEPVEIDLTYDENGNVDGSNYMKCSECVDGHPIIDVQMPCPNGTHGGIVVIHGDGPELEGPCELCEGDGYRTVRVSIQAAPIEGPWEDYDHECMPRPWPKQVDPNLDVRSGRWAIIATEVAT